MKRYLCTLLPVAIFATLLAGGCPTGTQGAIFTNPFGANSNAAGSAGDHLAGDADTTVGDELDDAIVDTSPTGDEAAETTLAILPTALMFDVSELPDDDATDDATAKRLDAQMRDGLFGARRTIGSAMAVVHSFHRLANRSLALAARINDDLTDPNDPQLAGELRLNGQLISYKADFSAFDIDGDGTPDGSGLPLVEPVALRMWIDAGEGYVPFLCALITQRPSSTDLGAGQLYGHPLGGNRVVFGDDVQFFVQWDRTDATHRWHEGWVAGQVRPHYDITASHQRVDVRENATGGWERTVRSSSTLADTPRGFDTYQFITHNLIGNPAVLFSALSTGGVRNVDLDQVCLQAMGDDLDPVVGCEDFDLQDYQYLPFPTGDETAFPADFPASPTF